MAKARTKSTAVPAGQQLAAAIAAANRSAKFLVKGRLQILDPKLEVDGVGHVAIPLTRAGKKALLAACSVAPFGKGEKTLVDTRVRKTFELDPKKFRVGEQWTAAVAEATAIAANSLGLPADRLEAHLYKLLVYETGGFFLPHRDSEKHDRMVASLIVVLPNPFNGGRLIVRHGAAEERLAFEEAAGGREPCFAAFYADCEHEVQRVVRGERIALAYNLVLAPASTQRSTAARASESDDQLTDSLQSWIARQPKKPLVFALEHLYTQRGLSLDLLKGADRELADLVVQAAEKSDCLVHLAKVSRHLLQTAYDEDGEDYYYHRRTARRSEIEIGETIEEEFHADEWVDLKGRKQPLGLVPLDVAAVVSSTPIDQWKPTSEEYEGYTGNAGNTLDRWYHRSAIVVWHRSRHFEIAASAGAEKCIPLFSSMTKKLAKTSAKRLEDARRDCIQFARAIIAEWPRRSLGYGRMPDGEDSPFEKFADLLLELHDREAVAAFLSILAERDDSLPLQKFVVAACREFGWTAFARELKLLVTPRAVHYGRPQTPLRDFEWLAEFCGEPQGDAPKAKLAAELCGIAAEGFCAPDPQRISRYAFSRRREASVAEQSLPPLLRALAACGRKQELATVLRYVRETPEEFTLDDCQVPALRQLIPWSLRRLGSVHPEFRKWLDEVRTRLERATAKAPKPPTDWARPAEVDCKCEYCGRLNAFLADRSQEVGRIPAREDLRRHLIQSIDRHQCDVKHALERRGSPYSLLLTKTTGSYERAVKRYDLDQRLLKSLPSDG